MYKFSKINIEVQSVIIIIEIIIIEIEKRKEYHLMILHVYILEVFHKITEFGSKIISLKRIITYPVLDLLG